VTLGMFGLKAKFWSWQPRSIMALEVQPQPLYVIFLQYSYKPSAEDIKPLHCVSHAQQ